MSDGAYWTEDPVELLRAYPGFRLAAARADAHPGFDGGKAEGEAALAETAESLAELQELLFANSRAAGDRRRVLLVLQGMDTAGKGGVVKHVVGSVDPQGVQLAAFKKPTDEELAHDFLWRIRKQVPEAGMIGVFDRSHYEDVLIGRVRQLASPDELERRYDAIAEFEDELVADGVSIVKVMLHVSYDEQKARLLKRLDRADKHWKFNPGDIDEREQWPAYQEAYQVAIERTSTDRAPWYVVPADRKWYARLAVARLLIAVLEGMRLDWPPADFDVAAERARLLEN
ncbi:polyphosphate kinase 2 family protein [Agromyces aerolatus]|uniref:polyphosphate kinase 2 family protein n=1 Tax=Agromyces sp. LY-1074 TaxID=3074080 RepID=UPI0028620E33|nr:MULTISPECIES: polyphosphate kinase 2 family protein [unclassified Agromyces]MDR5701413.1 polyphosphate kinase 2 family protein [Agromyces sp. LY-1074]MDR5706798.1 polyphosphate kinase 2 family protein [Agromyces sp. LY-1358]